MSNIFNNTIVSKTLRTENFDVTREKLNAAIERRHLTVKILNLAETLIFVNGVQTFVTVEDS